MAIERFVAQLKCQVCHLILFSGGHAEFRAMCRRRGRQHSARKDARQPCKPRRTTAL